VGRLSVLCGAALFTVIGAMFRSPWLSGVSFGVAMSVVALHLWATGRSLPRTTLLLLSGVPAAATVAVVARVWGWEDSSSADTRQTINELSTQEPDWAGQHALFQRSLIGAAALVLASVLVSVAVARWRKVNAAGSATAC